MIKQKINLSWAAQCRPDLLDKKTARYMKKADCRCINTGIESGSDRVLKEINKKSKTYDITKGIKTAKKAGINVVGSFILGLPGETLSEMKQSVSYAKKLKLDMLQVLLFVDYKDEYKNKETNTKEYEYGAPLQSYCDVPLKKIKKVYSQFHKEFYFRPSYIISYLYKNWINLILNYEISKDFITKSLKFIRKEPIE